MSSVLPSPNSAEKVQPKIGRTRQSIRWAGSIRYPAWLFLLTLLYIFYNWANYSYILTEDYDPFRFYRMVAEPFNQFDLLNRDVFTVLLLKSTYVESISFVTLPVILAVILIRIEKINRAGKFLFPFIASPSLPYLVQTGKDGVYLVFLILLLVAMASRRLSNKENIFYFIILGTIVMLTKEVAAFFGLVAIYLIWTPRRSLLKPVLISALIGTATSILFLELPDVDALAENSNIQGGLLSTLTVTQQLGATYFVQSGIRSISYFLYSFIAPVLWIFKCWERQDLSLSLEILSSVLFLCRLFALQASRRHELLGQLIIVSVLLGFSYFFLHFRYLSVLLGLLVVCEAVKFHLAENLLHSNKRRYAACH